jgi:hypothetical protein
MNVAVKRRTNGVSFAATFRILSRLNLKVPPLEGEHFLHAMFSGRVSGYWIYKIVISWIHGKNSTLMKPYERFNPVAFAMIRN